MLRPAITPAMHYDDWAKGYDADVQGWDYHAPDKIMTQVRTYLRGCLHRPRILDVGTGTGLLIEKCRDIRRDAWIAGLDIAEEMLHRCAAKGIADALHRADIETDRVPYPENHFDLTTAAGVMESVGNIENAVKEMVRVTKPGGLIAFTTVPARQGYSTETKPARLRPGRTEDGRFVMGTLPLHRHHPALVRALMSGAGAEIVHYSRFTGYRTYAVLTVKYDLFVGRKV